jgi:hypothetical protein
MGTSNLTGILQRAAGNEISPGDENPGLLQVSSPELRAFEVDKVYQPE